jgi:hypothetical protein
MLERPFHDRQRRSEMPAPRIPVDPIPVKAKGGPVVRISIPAKVALDLDAFHRTVANLAERLGCGQCLSGANCIFSFERDWVTRPEQLPHDFTVGEDLQVRTLAETFG